MVLWRC
jgi:hypothetical protein